VTPGAATDRLVVGAVAAFVLSLLLALAAAWLLTDYYWHGEDLDLFVWPIASFALVASVVFGATSLRAEGEGALRNAAVALAAVAVLLVVVPGVVALLARQSTNPPVVLRRHDQFIAVAVLVPLLLAVLLQWRLVRWGWLAARGQTAPTTWPWLATVLGLLLTLNPLGLAILGAAIKQSRTDWFASLWLMVSLIFGGMLLLLAWIEWRIRVRRAGRRSAVS
jgi:hypothetical protein